MTVHVGVDGGATRTVALITDELGAVLARHTAAVPLIRADSASAVAHGLAGLVRAALREAGFRRAAAACFALTGAGRPPERAALEAALAREHLATTVRVTTDAEAARYDAFGDGPGLVLIAGTGSIAWGRGPGGETHRTGGWGPRLGDEGSGYAIGLAALRAVVRAFDRRGPGTELSAALLSACGVADAPALVPWTDTATRADVAALAPLVIERAALDPVAAEIADDAASDLVRHLEALARLIDPGEALPLEVALGGGMLAPGRPLRARVASRLSAVSPRLQVVDRAIDAARGAAAMARALHGGELDAGGRGTSPG